MKEMMWVLTDIKDDVWDIDDTDDQKVRKLMQEQEIEYVPALYKIFDEILVNAADHKQTHPNMSYIAVDIDEKNGCISVENDGQGIDIKIHKKYNIYVPQLIFGHLLTSSNYNVKCGRKKTNKYIHYNKRSLPERGHCLHVAIHTTLLFFLF